MMITHKELIASREYWVALLHIRLWNVNGCVEKDSDKWEEIAEKVVDDDFMKTIDELRQK